MQSGFEVVFQPDGKRGKFQQGTTVLEAARSLGVDINSVCGGAAACGKCIVQVVSGSTQEPSMNEARYIDAESLGEGYRLACILKIRDGLVVSVPKESRTGTQRLQTKGLKTNVILNPMISKRHTGDMTEILYNREVLRRVDSQDPPILGFAVDVGSTKLAGYLMDLSIGKILSVATAMNPQIPYGEDIISRIASAIHAEENNQRLHETLIEGVRNLLRTACVEASESIDDVYDIVLVGNTAMQHFLLGINPRPISRSPFKPENLEARNLPPETLQLNPYARVHILPLIAGFVGADCVAATLATGVDRAEEMSFMMDVGTNTEIVVGKRDHMVACSCASGPAFEGAHIKYGMRAASGAIEGVWIDADSYEPRIKVIDDIAPVGLCGSGLIDLLSEMLKAGIMDSSGKLTDVDHLRLRKSNGIKEYVVAWKGEAGIDEDISITQKDIRELQKGKAAIFSGSYIAMRQLGVDADDVEHVYMAGAFGTYINRESAQNIGMIPEFNMLAVEQVGNAAGTGARMALLSREAREEAKTLRDKVEYIELSTHPDYNKAYLDALMFPHKNLSLFPETVKKLKETHWDKVRLLHSD
jgi:uncharacterized 2Fe-2S/4Fe-4S cluster protein (DUF4445 family)